MSVLSGKKILLGVTAGIAAYKSAILVRLLVKAGAQVRVVMSPAAKEFITPLTLATLSKNEVYCSFTEEEDRGLWNNHVELGLWADLMLFAPATASTISRMAAGNSENFLLAVYLSARCPVYFAPAMDLDMYQHPTTKRNISTLISFGNIIIPATSGELASGLVGEGRMAEPQDILDVLEKKLSDQLPLKNKKILITAGPTYEAIDPVRFVGNYSSGKMGYALASAASRAGAEVFLVSGPTALDAPQGEVNLRKVTSANEMFDAVVDAFDQVDVVIAAAAVSDYRPKEVAVQKIKKKEGHLRLELEKNPDILQELGRRKKHQILVGFALETENEEKNALGKLERKNLDFIVLNSLSYSGAGFGTETNKVSMLFRDGQRKDFELKTKDAVASDIIDEIKFLING